jgi:hypothetical protein
VRNPGLPAAFALVTALWGRVCKAVDSAVGSDQVFAASAGSAKGRRAQRRAALADAWLTYHVPFGDIPASGPAKGPSAHKPEQHGVPELSVLDGQSHPDSHRPWRTLGSYGRVLYGLCAVMPRSSVGLLPLAARICLLGETGCVICYTV